MGHYISLTRSPVEPLGGSPIGVRQLVRWLIDVDRRFNENGNGIRAAMRIEKALEAAKDKDELFIEQNGDHDMLKIAAEGPVGPGGQTYPCSPTRQLLPFIEDIVNAPEKSAKKDVKK